MPDTKPIESFNPLWGTRPKYPYFEWANGEPWELYEGEDFHTSPRQFRNALSNWAARNNYRFASHIVKGSPASVKFQFWDKDAVTGTLWRTCANGGTHTAMRWKDFHTSLDDFVDALKRTAKRRNVPVHLLINREDESVAFFFELGDDD